MCARGGPCSRAVISITQRVYVKSISSHGGGLCFIIITVRVRQQSHVSSGVMNVSIFEPPSRRGPALGGPGGYRFYIKCVPGPCTHSYNIPNDRIIGPSAGDVYRTSSRSSGLADRGHWPLSLLQSRPRVLVRAPRPSAVVSSRGLLRRRCAALAAPRGYRTSRPMSSNV